MCYFENIQIEFDIFGIHDNMFFAKNYTRQVSVACIELYTETLLGTCQRQVKQKVIVEKGS